MSVGSKLPALFNRDSRIVRLRFENDYTSYIGLLDAERGLFNAELSRTQTKGSLFQAPVNLLKTMGRADGSWK